MEPALAHHVIDAMRNYWLCHTGHVLPPIGSNVAFRDDHGEVQVGVVTAWCAWAYVQPSVAGGAELGGCYELRVRTNPKFDYLIEAKDFIEVIP